MMGKKTRAALVCDSRGSGGRPGQKMIAILWHKGRKRERRTRGAGCQVAAVICPCHLSWGI